MILHHVKLKIIINYHTDIPRGVSKFSQVENKVNIEMVTPAGTATLLSASKS